MILNRNLNHRDKRKRPRACSDLYLKLKPISDGVTNPCTAVVLTMHSTPRRLKQAIPYIQKPQ